MKKKTDTKRPMLILRSITATLFHPLTIHSALLPWLRRIQGQGQDRRSSGLVIMTGRGARLGAGFITLDHNPRCTRSFVISLAPLFLACSLSLSLHHHHTCEAMDSSTSTVLSFRRVLSSKTWRTKMASRSSGIRRVVTVLRSNVCTGLSERRSGVVLALLMNRPTTGHSTYGTLPQVLHGRSLQPRQKRTIFAAWLGRFMKEWWLVGYAPTNNPFLTHLTFAKVGYLAY